MSSVETWKNVSVCCSGPKRLWGFAQAAYLDSPYPLFLRNDVRSLNQFWTSFPSMCENGQGILQRAGWQKGSMVEEVYFIPAKEATAE
jgi:hypothetical protein